MKRFHP